MDGRVLPVLVGMTGHPPKTYRIPVPAPEGGPPTVLVYRRAPRGGGPRIAFARWKYVYAPDGVPRRTGPRWPWSKPGTRPGTRPGTAPGAAPDATPGATPGGKPDDAHG